MSFKPVGRGSFRLCGGGGGGCCCSHGACFLQFHEFLSRPYSEMIALELVVLTFLHFLFQVPCRDTAAGSAAAAAAAAAFSFSCCHLS